MNRHSNNANSLLVEIMVAVLFFALCATVLLEAFMTAHEGSARSAAATDALIDARNVLERLSAAEDAPALLAACGYAAEDGETWRSEGNASYYIEVRLTEEPTAAGTLRLAEASAWRADVQEEEPLARLQSARYRPAEVE